jgi:hypothetical protein
MRRLEDITVLDWIVIAMAAISVLVLVFLWFTRGGK